MPQTCPQCQSEAADGATACPSCGATLGSSSTATQAAPAVSAPAPPAPAPAGSRTRGSCARTSSGSSIPAFKFDAARWSLADRIAGIATVVLFISLFLSWYTYSIAGSNFTADGLWHGWMYISLILCIAIVAYLVLRAGWDELPIGTKVPHLTAMMAATIVNLVLVVIAFLDKPGGGGVGWGFGAFVGLIAAVVAAAPYCVPQLRARKERRTSWISCAWRRAAVPGSGLPTARPRRQRIGASRHRPRARWRTRAAWARANGPRTTDFCGRSNMAALPTTPVPD